MKIFYIWIALGIAGITASIMLFMNHKSISVLIISVIMCVLTIVGVIRTTTNAENQKTYLHPVITSFLGCIAIGGYFNALAFAKEGWSDFMGITFYTGLFCLPVLLLDKESKATMNSLLGDGFQRLFVFSGDMDGCLINLIVGIFCIIISVCIGVLFMLLSYITATVKLLRSDVAVDENISTIFKNLFKTKNDEIETKSSVIDEDGDWL